MTKDEIELLQWIYDRLAFHYGEHDDMDYMIKFNAIIEAQKVNPLRARYVVVTENDMDGDRWMESRGPICMETYVGESTGDKVLERSKQIGTRYGRQMICRLEPMGAPEEFERLMEEEL